MNEHDDLTEIERRLQASRPVPAAAFRGELRRHLLDRSGTARATAPRRLRLLIAAYAGSGTLLLVIAGAGVAGAGPFAAG